MGTNPALHEHGSSDATGEGTLSALLASLERAYALGTHRAKAQEEGREKEQWLFELRFANMVHLPAAERRLLSLCKVSAERARTAAVRGDLIAAWSEIARSELHWRVPGIAEETRLLGQVESISSEAAVEYQAREYLRSRTLLQQASRLDQALAERFGARHASVHAVHLMGKLVQLEAAEKRFSEALSVAAGALLLLRGAPAGIHAYPIHSDQWFPGPELLADTPPAIRRMLCRQVVVEIGATLLFASAAQSSEALELLYTRLGPAFDHSRLDPALDPMAQQWLQAKRFSYSRPGQDPLRHSVAGQHLEACSTFLENSRQAAETLWLLGALDAAQRCAQIDSEAARRFRRRAFTDLAAHAAFPPRLRACWLRLAQRP